MQRHRLVTRSSFFQSSLKHAVILAYSMTLYQVMRRCNFQTYIMDDIEWYMGINNGGIYLGISSNILVFGLRQITEILCRIANPGWNSNRLWVGWVQAVQTCNMKHVINSMEQIDSLKTHSIPLLMELPAFYGTLNSLPVSTLRCLNARQILTHYTFKIDLNGILPSINMSPKYSHSFRLFD
jgi:hypothetical protein